MSRGDIILRLVDVERIYETKEGRKIVALNKVTTSFKRGEFIAVVGKSGSGKSTLINILGGLDTPDSGDYYLEGNNISKINEGHWDAIRNDKIGFIFQEYHLIEYLSVYKNVEIALKYQADTTKKTRDAKVRDILTRVGLIDHIKKLPNQLSGGQRQRVAIARALVKDPDIILADEPTGALDHKTSENVIELIKGLSKERLVIVVTHDKGIANNHATRILELTEGRFTSDLIKEEIEQTYQNTYKKTKPTNMKFIDKFGLTFSKIKSQLLRTFFTALSLALAFSFTILFNGVERGVRDSYDAYFEALNKANGYAFSLVPDNEIVGLTDFGDAAQDVTDSFNAYLDENSEVLVGNSDDVAYSFVSGGVEHVLDENTRPDPLSEYKLRLIDINNTFKYSYEDLFIADSHYPYEADEMAVTTKFYRDYLMLDDGIINLGEYIDTRIEIPIYNFDTKLGIYNIEEYLNTLIELEDGSIVPEDPLINYTIPPLKVRYLNINIPDYCYNYDEINEFYQDRCDEVIEDEKYSRYFNSIEEYQQYIDEFKEQVNKIDPEYFDILYRSSAIYYLVDEKEATGYVHPSGQQYVERVYRAAYNAATSSGLTYFKEGIFKELSETKTMIITAIIENDNESIIYMGNTTYDSLFKTSTTVSNVKGYYSINLDGGINREITPFDVAITSFANPLEGVKSEYKEDYSIIRKEFIEAGETCSIYDLDNVINKNTEFDKVELLGDVFTITDYSSCKVNTESYHYLNSIRLLFGVFFNVLMIISILFFHILLQVILGERISEIGIYRSVGSTSKDIKVLFFIEIIFEIVLATIMSIFMIYFANNLINSVFSSAINQGSGVINFAGMKLAMGDSSEITNISFFNLAFYVVIVFVILGFLSNRSVSKLANTKPIDILREVD